MTTHPHASSEPSSSFYGLGIAPKILDYLDTIGFSVPTPIQYKAIPLAIDGKDVIGIAQTGTGKTHSFAIPMIQRLAQKDGIGMILAPTRELAIQIDEAIQGLAQTFGMKTACLIGGANMQVQIQLLRKHPRVIIATPGRLLDHVWQGTLLLDHVVMLVLDEADRMLDMGFAPQIEQILKFLTREKQTMLFSATFPKEIMAMAVKHMRLPVSVEIAPPGTTADKIIQELFIVRRDTKGKVLAAILEQYHGSVLLFARTKINARKITRVIRDRGHRVAEIHSDRSLNQRREALEGFKSGKYRILVATDIAARGLDVTGIELVINYDLPDDAQNYVHRIGRTGRAGHPGRAISFATPDQSLQVREIEKITRISLPISKLPHITDDGFHPVDQRPQTSPQRHRFRHKRRDFRNGHTSGRR